MKDKFDIFNSCCDKNLKCGKKYWTPESKKIIEKHINKIIKKRADKIKEKVKKDLSKILKFMENNYNNIIVKKNKDAIKFKKLLNIYCPKGKVMKDYCENKELLKLGEAQKLWEKIGDFKERQTFLRNEKIKKAKEKLAKEKLAKEKLAKEAAARKQIIIYVSIISLVLLLIIIFMMVGGSKSSDRDDEFNNNQFVI